MDREKKGPRVKLDSWRYEFWDSSALADLAARIV